MYDICGLILISVICIVAVIFSIKNVHNTGIFYVGDVIAISLYSIITVAAIIDLIIFQSFDVLFLPVIICTFSWMLIIFAKPSWLFHIVKKIKE